MRSNFVLLETNFREFFVGPRIGTKKSYQSLEHFHGFFETAEAGHREAMRRHKDMVQQFERKIKYHEACVWKLKKKGRK